MQKQDPAGTRGDKIARLGAGRSRTVQMQKEKGESLGAGSVSSSRFGDGTVKRLFFWVDFLLSIKNEGAQAKNEEKGLDKGLSHNHLGE